MLRPPLDALETAYAVGPILLVYTLGGLHI